MTCCNLPFSQVLNYKDCDVGATREVVEKNLDDGWSLPSCGNNEIKRPEQCPA